MRGSVSPKSDIIELNWLDMIEDNIWLMDKWLSPKVYELSPVFFENKNVNLF